MAGIDVQKDYGASTALPDNTDRIQSALTDAGKAGGMRVDLGVPAMLKCLGPLVQPDKVTLEGSGWASSVLWWPQDLGLGQFGITTQNAAGQINAPKLRDLQLRGPGSWALGQQKANCDGISLASFVAMYQCAVYGFRAGWSISHDHNYFEFCKVSNNYYNAEWVDRPVSKGNQVFNHCVLDGANYASAHVGGGNILDGCVFIGGHGGFSPYVFYKSDFADGSPSTLGLMSETTLLNFAMEAVGNNAMLDAGTGVGSGYDSLYKCDIQQAGFSWSADYRLASQPQDYAVKVRLATDTRIRGGTYPFTKGTAGVYHTLNGGKGLVLLDQSAVVALGPQ